MNRETFIGTGSPWANPFHGRTRPTPDLLDQFDRWLAHSDDLAARWMRTHFTDLIGQNLVCDCTGLACHGKILLERVEQAQRAIAPAAEWIHVLVPAAGEHRRTQPGKTNFIIASSGSTGDDVVVQTPPIAAWMTGKTLREIAEWVQLRGGALIKTEDMPELTRRAAIARHPSSQRQRAQRMDALGA